jgi:hypothetical protein
MTPKPLAIFYEHPDSFRPLFAELDSRGINYVKLDPSCHSYDPASAARDFSLFFNRMSASAYLRGNGQGIFFTHNYLAHLEASGVRVLNGSQAFAVETSKARQLQLFHSLGLSFPKTRVVNCTDEILAAAPQIGFPLLVKPNIGGRGAGIVRFDSIEQLHADIDEGKLELGIDNIALVQELVPARSGHITRVETLGGKFLYAIDNDSNEKETDNLDQNITGGVDAREAVPVPVRNVGCYRGQNSGNQNETDSATQAANARLCQ